MTRPVGGRRAASMWRILDGWFTAPKFVSVSCTARWAEQNHLAMTAWWNVRKATIKEKQTSPLAPQCGLWHWPNPEWHIIPVIRSKPGKSRSEQNTGKVTGLLYSFWDHTFSWRGGWLWIIHSVSIKQDCKPVFGHALICHSCETSSTQLEPQGRESCSDHKGW